MPNKKLIWYPGAMYHVTSRGNRRSDIFRLKENYMIYLQSLQEAVNYKVAKVTVTWKLGKNIKQEEHTSLLRALEHKTDVI